MKKRWLSLLGVAGILLSMVLAGGACKPKPKPGESTPGASGGDKSNVAGTELRIYAWGDGLSETDKERTAYIEEKTGMKIRYIKIAYGQMDMKYVLDISADNAPDLLYLTDERFPRYIVKGIGQPLEKYADYFAENDEYWKLVKEKSPFKWKGETYGASTGCVPYYLWYNKTMFEENDVKTPLEYLQEGNWTFDTLAACGNALTADTDGDGVVDRYGFVSWKQEALVVANGGTFFEFQNDGNIRVAVEDQKTLNALDYIQQAGFKNKWYVFDGIDWVQGFVSEKLAMTLETTWARNDPFSEVKFEVDFVPMPTGPDNQGGATLGFATSNGICHGAKNPYGAMAYFKYDYEYQKEKEGQPSEYDHLYTDEQRARLKEYEKLEYAPSFFYGVGEMAGLMRNLYGDILSGTPVSTAAAKQKDVFQHEVDVTLKDNEMPEVLPFSPPPVLDFENDDYLQQIIFETHTGELQGIEQPAITTDPNEAISGRSLKFTILPDDAFQLFRFNDSYTFPAYHTYTVSFDYKVLEDMSDGGRFLVAICPKDSTVGGPHKASVGIYDMRAGDAGTFTADMDVYDYGDPSEYTLAFVGINCGSIVIDNFSIKDVAAE